jgi:hypothetical protein
LYLDSHTRKPRFFPMQESLPKETDEDALLTTLGIRLAAADAAPPFEDETLPRLLTDAYELVFQLLALRKDGVGQAILAMDVLHNGVRSCKDREGNLLITLRRYNGMNDSAELQGLLDQVIAQIDAVMPKPEGPIARLERMEATMP